MLAAHVYAYTNLAWTQHHRAYASHILGQRQRGTTTQEAEGLLVTLVYLHAGHTLVRVGGRDKVHAEGV